MSPQDQWLEIHTFECKRRSARLTPEQCEHDRNLPPVPYADSGPRFRPKACEGCKEWRRPTVQVLARRWALGVSRNTGPTVTDKQIIEEVLKAKTIEDAALILGVTTRFILRRIYENPGLRVKLRGAKRTKKECSPCASR
jgi:hypothetical protein